MRRVRPLQLLLLLLLLLPPALAGSSLKPLPGHKCVCDFSSLNAKLAELYSPDRSSVEMALGFAQTLAFLNIHLVSHLSELRRCARFWIDSARQCEATCSCEEGRVCCRDTALRSLDTSVAILKKHVKRTFTPYSNISFVEQYHTSSLSIQFAFSGIFMDLLSAIKKGRQQVLKEKRHYIAMFQFKQRERLLRGIFDATAPGNASLSIITRMARRYSYDPKDVLPFYLNIYGSVLQYLLMRELNEELRLSEGPARSSFDQHPQWQQYLRLTSDLTSSIVDCSKKQIFAIRSQEIRDKDVEMRNAALVFSSFLLALVAIVALIVVFACRTDRRRKSVVVTDEPAQTSEEPESSDLMYKRYYEMDETV